MQGNIILPNDHNSLITKHKYTHFIFNSLLDKELKKSGIKIYPWTQRGFRQNEELSTYLGPGHDSQQHGW
jgi:hypothetical protein